MGADGIHRHRAAGKLFRIFRRPPPIAVLGTSLLLMVMGSALILGLKKSPGEREPGANARPTDAQTAPSDSGASGTPDPPTSAAPSATPSRNRVAVTATYAITRSWDSGFIERITLTNHSTTPQNWTVTLVLPVGATVTGVWNAEVRQLGRTFEFTTVEKTAALAAGATATFGFEAGGTGDSQQSCEVNGKPCG